MPNTVPEPALALWLLDRAREHGAALAILRSGARLDRVAGLATAMAGGVEVLALPAWDVLPYDRAAPSAGVVGRRARALAALAADPAGPRLLLASAGAVLQRVRPPHDWDAPLVLRQGDAWDQDDLRRRLATLGYHWDERVDEPGEVALRGGPPTCSPPVTPARCGSSGPRAAQGSPG